MLVHNNSTLRSYSRRELIEFIIAIWRQIPYILKSTSIYFFGSGYYEIIFFHASNEQKFWIFAAEIADF